MIERIGVLADARIQFLWKKNKMGDCHTTTVKSILMAEFCGVKPKGEGF